MTDPLETTRPDPVEEAGDERREPKWRPGDRRLVQFALLGALAPALLLVQWADATTNARRLVPPDRPTVVQRGATATLAGTQWREVRRLAGRNAPAGGPADAAEVRFVLAVRAGDQATLRRVTGFGTRYRVHGPQGRQWAATGLAAPTARPGAALQVTVRAVVPRSILRSLTLEVRRDDPAAKGPSPSLRFVP